MVALIPLAEMSSLIPTPPIFNHVSPSQSSSSGLLPPFLAVGRHIMYEHEGTYHKGYLTKTPTGTYHFSFKTHVKKKSKDWGVDLLNLPFTWVDLCTEGILLPWHFAHSFIWPPSLAPSSSTFDHVASLASAVNSHQDCLPTLLQALTTLHLDQEIWLQSYYKEKHGIESLGTFWQISLGEYRAL